MDLLGQPGTGPRLAYSGGDLLLAADCEFRFLRRLDEALGRSAPRGSAEDPLLRRAAELGERHERRALRAYEHDLGPFDPATGRGVARIVPPAATQPGLLAAHEATLAALTAGADVVHGASLFDGRFRARADFLVRGDAGGPTPDAYAVLDTRLARRAKVPALLALAAAADQLDAAGVPLASQAVLVLGTRARTHHRLADLLPVYRDRRRRLLDLADRHVAGSDAVVWDAAGLRSCGRCDDCRAEAAARRDVLLAGGVYEGQRRRLRAAGITTIDQLAVATQPPPDMSRSAFESIRDRAALQVGATRPDGVVRWAGADGPHELTWQLADPAPILRLPPPSAGDVFFDFEGDPLWSDEEGRTWGLDYLFGSVERPATEGEEPPFGAFYAHDLAAEREALIGFVGYLTARRRRFPDLHVYHYAAYEKIHLAAIAARHGVCEDEVDELLRDGVLVDLYAVVRSAVRTSDKSLSLKRLEPLYMGHELRSGDVKDAAASVVAYAEYCALRDIGREDDAGTLFRQIVDYNRYDCVSTLRLSAWLRGLVDGVPGTRPAVGSPAAAALAGVGPVPPAVAEPPAVDDEIRLLVGEDRARRSADEQALAMLGAAVGYYRRESKPFWHEHFSRLSTPPDEWLGRRNAFLVDSAVVVEAWHTEPGKRVATRVLELTGTLPEGSDLRVGVSPSLLYDPPLPPRAKTSTDGSRGWRAGGPILDVARRDTPAGPRDVLLVREPLGRDAERFDHLPMALTPAPGPATRAQEAAVERAARRAVSAWPGGSLPRDAATELVRRRPPRLRAGRPGSPTPPTATSSAPSPRRSGPWTTPTSPFRARPARGRRTSARASWRTSSPRAGGSESWPSRMPSSRTCCVPSSLRASTRPSWRGRCRRVDRPRTPYPPSSTARRLPPSRPSQDPG